MMFHTVDKRINNKLALQKRAGFAENAAVPLIGMVSRLDEQKGLDILTASFDSLFQKLEAQVVILGKGREEYHDLLRQAASRYPQQLAVFIDFDDALAHLIYAGCDMFLMPSRFEPCGLGQLIAMRYGAVPIVRHTGGLVDTVQDLTQDLSEGNGFVFQDYDSEAMLAAIQRAVNSYRKKAWQNVMQRIMALDFSWQASARKYESLYHKALELKNLCRIIDQRPVLAVDLGGTKIIAAVVLPDGKIISRNYCLTMADEGPEIVIDRILFAVNRAIAQAKLKTSEMIGIGIAAAGILDTERGIVTTSPNLPRLA